MSNVVLDVVEFRKIMVATIMGFIAMGGIGYLVKILHMPLNNWLLQ